MASFLLLSIKVFERQSCVLLVAYLLSCKSQQRQPVGGGQRRPRLSLQQGTQRL
jgi:hypothetical protein